MAIPEDRSFTLQGNTKRMPWGGVITFTIDGKEVGEPEVVEWLTRCGYTGGEAIMLVNLLWDDATLTLPIYEGSDVWENLAIGS